MKTIIDKIRGTTIRLSKTGFFHIFGSSVINQIITFLSGIILIRVLSKAEYGVFSYANNLMSLFLLFSGLGVISGILQLSSENFNNPHKALSFFKYGAKIAISFNVILGIFIFCFALFVPFKIEEVGYLLILMSLVPIVTILHELIQIYFRYNKLNKRYSFYTTSNTINILVFSVLGALIAQAKGLVLFRYVGYVITIFLGFFVFKFPFRKYKTVEVLKKTEKKDFINLSLISMLNNGTAQLIIILDIFIIGFIIPNESVIASYKVATIIPNALIFIPSSLMIYLYPYFATNFSDKIWVKKNYKQIIKYFSIFNFLLTVLLIIFAPSVIKLVFGSEYLDAVLPFRILMLSYFFSATFRKVTGNLLVTQRKLKFNLWLGVLEGVINIVCNIILISYLGSVGAALTSLVIVVISSIISVKYFLKVIKV